jgi:hypothetical protein
MVANAVGHASLLVSLLGAPVGITTTLPLLCSTCLRCSSPSPLASIPPFSILRLPHGGPLPRPFASFGKENCDNCQAYIRKHHHLSLFPRRPFCNKHLGNAVTCQLPLHYHHVVMAIGRQRQMTSIPYLPPPSPVRETRFARRSGSRNLTATILTPRECVQAYWPLTRWKKN